MEAAQTKAKKVADGIEQSRQAFGVLRPEIQVNTRCADAAADAGAARTLQLRVIRPDQHSKASRILIRMEEAGYSHDQVNDVVQGTVTVTRSDTGHCIIVDQDDRVRPLTIPP